MLTAVRDFVREPRPPLTEDGALDGRITAALMAVAVACSYFDQSVPNQVATFLIGIAATYVLRSYRTQPFWLAVAMSVLFIALWEWGGANSLFGFVISFYILGTVYALARWGSGLEILVGSAVVLATNVYQSLGLGAPLRDTAIFALFSLYPIGFGIAARINAGQREQVLQAARLSERHEIARELHDTVAHHVSAITIQAQAARTILATKPDTARDVLETIEEQAARTLDEMRRMVTVLRDSEESAELRPQAGLSDIEALATSSGPGPQVKVTITGDMDLLPSSVSASLFRFAQEGVTNARRHAHQATVIHVQVTGHDDHVDLSVIDDGKPATHEPVPGFGLTGLGERASQLGGTFTAGPQARGWAINVSLPMASTP